VILDWRMTAIYGDRATRGTRYFDLVWFINGLFSRAIHRYALAEYPGPRSKVFLRSYFAGAGCGVDLEALRAYTRRFMALKEDRLRASLPWRKRLVLAPYHARFRAFVDGLRL